MDSFQDWDEVHSGSQHGTSLEGCMTELSFNNNHVANIIEYLFHSDFGLTPTTLVGEGGSLAQ